MLVLAVRRAAVFLAIRLKDLAALAGKMFILTLAMAAWEIFSASFSAARLAVRAAGVRAGAILKRI